MTPGIPSNASAAPPQNTSAGARCEKRENTFRWVNASSQSVLVRRTKSPEEHRRAQVIPCVVSAETLDHEGIVRAVTHQLQELGVNIVNLVCSAYQAPVTGSQLFRMEARVDLPKHIRVAALRKAMDEVAEAENLDIDVRTLIPKGR